MQIKITLAHLNLLKSLLIILSLKFHVVGIILEPLPKMAHVSHGAKLSLANLDDKMARI
jgi:hypothetical protein